MAFKYCTSMRGQPSNFCLAPPVVLLLLVTGITCDPLVSSVAASDVPLGRLLDYPDRCLHRMIMIRTFAPPVCDILHWQPPLISEKQNEAQPIDCIA